MKDGRYIHNIFVRRSKGNRLFVRSKYSINIDHTEISILARGKWLFHAPAVLLPRKEHPV
jgi:hypothetical protein